MEIHPKLRNFVEDDFDFFGYEQGRSSTTVVAGRLQVLAFAFHRRQ